MNKKLLWTLALPAVLASCSQDDLISEGITNNTPQGKAISGVTFTIAKNGSDTNADTRAEWVDNKISFEKGDLVSLFWLGEDGYTQIDGFDHTANPLTPFDFSGLQALIPNNALTGKSNAVFRTEDGSNFTAEAVVYEGYNLLVYPGDTRHVESQPIVVSLPEEQDASEDFTKNVIYVGDSILHIHEPAVAKDKKTLYDMYGTVTTEDGPNTSGYAHGIKTGVKLLSSLLDMNLRITKTNASDVKIQKVVLTTTGGASIFANEGNLIPGEGTVGPDAAMPEATQYRDPWFQVSINGAVPSVTLNCEDVETVQSGTKVTMLILPADIASLATNQPVLKVYTNYGVVTIGGSMAGNNNQSRNILLADGQTPADVDDNTALKKIVENASGYEVTVQAPVKKGRTAANAKYTFRSGVYMNRVIDVDMSTATIEDTHVENTEELNTLLNAVINSTSTSKPTERNPLVVYLDYDYNGNFELTNYDGLNAFEDEFGGNSLKILAGDCTSTANGRATTLKYVVVNTDEETVLSPILGLNKDIDLLIPATSKITAILGGTRENNRVTIKNAIKNETVITIPAYSTITLADNTKGTVHYTPNATINVDDLDKDTYGIIDYTASSSDNLANAVEQGANYITVRNINTGFFAGGIDVETNSPAEGGVTVVFDNCGNLNSTISFDSNKIIANTIVLRNGTSYPNLTNATVNNIIVESETATLGFPTDNSAPYDTKADIDGIWIKSGSTVTINNLDLSDATVQIDADATANITGSTNQSKAPKNFYVFGTASFAGSNNQAKETVFVYTNGRISAINYVGNDHCLVTGSLELHTDLAYANVAVGANTAITVANDDIVGLGFNKVFVTNDEQATNTENLQFYTNRAITASDKSAWNGNFSNLGWGTTIPW